MSIRIVMVLAATILVGSGCRSTYYSMMESMGQHKRDLLRRNVERARDEQAKAGEQFSNALDRLRTLYGDTGSDLEKTYDRLQSVYERSESQAEDVRERVKEMDQVAKDLFVEWEKELDEIGNARLRTDSASKLRETRSRYDDLSRSMHESTRRMDPILAKLKDQVLYLKHNLNAQSLGTLQGEAQLIQADIQRLLDEMDSAIAEANAFVETL